MNYYSLEVDPYFDKYKNGNISLTLKDEDGYVTEVLTVNLSKETLTNKNCAFIDTNRQINVLNFLKKNKFGNLTGKYGKSGDISFPEFELDY